MLFLWVKFGLWFIIHWFSGHDLRRILTRNIFGVNWVIILYGHITLISLGYLMLFFWIKFGLWFIILWFSRYDLRRSELSYVVEAFLIPGFHFVYCQGFLSVALALVVSRDAVIV